MSDSRAVLRHLLRGTEELLRAASEGLAVLRERSAGSASTTPASGAAREGSESGTSLEDSARRMADELAGWLAGGESHAFDELRATLRRETRRWDLRAGEDPAARRVHDLFALLLEMLGDEPRDRATPDARGPTPEPARASTRTRPPRSSHAPRPSERK